MRSRARRAGIEEHHKDADPIGAQWTAFRAQFDVNVFRLEEMDEKATDD